MPSSTLCPKSTTSASQLFPIFWSKRMRFATEPLCVVIPKIRNDLEKQNFKISNKKSTKTSSKHGRISCHRPVSGCNSMQKKLAKETNTSEFSASNGWLRGFKKRFRLTTMKVSGESAKVDRQTVTSWLDDNRSEIEKYLPMSIVNGDETGFAYRILPDQTLEFKRNKYHGGVESKKRTSILLCRNGLIFCRNNSKKQSKTNLSKRSRLTFTHTLSHCLNDFVFFVNSSVLINIFTKKPISYDPLRCLNWFVMLLNRYFGIITSI